MSATETAVPGGLGRSDTQLVAGVRAGDDLAFEELYRRYHRRISAFVRRVLRDEARAEDVAQEAFVSALRRMRATDCEIAFKPWIFEIARNAAIDQWRRSSRAEEVSINQDELLRPGDRARLVGGGSPDVSLFQKERFEHLRWAMDELSQTHHRILVMRELEGLSYREIGERLELSRPAVESTLFRARRRLEHEYEEIEAGRRCEAIGHSIARIAEGIESETDLRRLSKHARACGPCRRRARETGVEPFRARRVAARAAAFLPLPGFLRRGLLTPSADPTTSSDAGSLPLLAPTAHVGAPLAERAVALVTTVALAGTGGAVLSGAVKPHVPGSGVGHHRAAAHAAPAGAPRAYGRAGRLSAGAEGALIRPRASGRRRGSQPEASRAGRREARPAAPGAGSPLLSGSGIHPPAAPEVDVAPPMTLEAPGAPMPALPSVESSSVPLAPPKPPVELPSAGLRSVTDRLPAHL